MKKLHSVILAIILVVLLFVGCAEEKPGKKEKSFHVSFSNKTVTKSIEKVDIRVNGNITKTSVADGQLQGALTPSHFLINLQSIFLYQPSDNAKISEGITDYVKIFEEVEDGSDFCLPQKINALTSRDIKIEYDDSIYETVWNGFGFEMDIGATSMGDGPGVTNDYDHYWTGSVIGVKRSDLLPLIGNDIDKLDNEVMFKDDGTTVWLHFDKMLPYEKSGDKETLFGMTKVLFQTGIDKNEIYIGNFTGNDSQEEIKYGPWTIIDDAGCYVAAHMDAIDFSKIPDSELTIGFETKDLLKVYKINGQEKYTIILNPANPFGLNVSVSSFSRSSGSTESSQTVAKKDAYPLCAYWYKRSNGAAIVYARPNRFDVKEYEIYYSSSNDVGEATLIYSGSDTAYLYGPEPAETAWSGYYWIRTVFNDNSKSDYTPVNRFEGIDNLF